MFTIGFCGMSHLGLCYSAAAAEKGFNVVCFDFDSQKISKLKKNNIEIEEPDLKKLIQKNKNKIIYTDDLSVLSNCSFVYYSSDVNTDHKGKSDKKALKTNLEELILNLESFLSYTWSVIYYVFLHGLTTFVPELSVSNKVPV